MQADFVVRDESGRFASAPIDEDGSYASTVIPGFRLPISWLWQPEQIDIERALAGMMVDAPGLPEELRAVYREMLRL